jgi:hypothetical protein
MLKRIQEIKERMEWMERNLEGCDWCCGGGDEEYSKLLEELQMFRNEAKDRVQYILNNKYGCDKVNSIMRIFEGFF